MRKRNTLWVLISVLVITSLILAGCGGNKTENAGQSAAGGDTVKIGFLGAKTGSNAAYGIETLKGIKMAADDLNKAGGVLGKKIQIVEDDNASQLSQGATVTTKLITQDNVVAIVGDPTTGITKLAAPIAMSNKVVLFSAGAVGDGIQGIGDYVFRDTLLNSVAAPVVIKYLHEKMGWNKVAIVTSINNDFSVGLTKIFKDALAKNNMQVVSEQSISDGDTNFSAQVTAIKGANPDGILFTGYYTEGGLFMKEVRKQGMKQVLAGGDGLYAPDFISLGGNSVEGSMVYCSFSADPKYTSDKTKAFVDAYKKLNNNKEPDYFSVQGYDAVMMIANAMKQANSTDPSKFKLDLAKTKNYEGVSGKISFTANGEPIKSPVYLMEVKGGKFTVKDALPIEQ